MTTLRLNVNEKVLEKVLAFLKRFGSEDVQFIEEDEHFRLQKAKLERVIARIDSGEEKCYTQDELNEQLDQALSNHDR